MSLILCGILKMGELEMGIELMLVLIWAILSLEINGRKTEK